MTALQNRGGGGAVFDATVSGAAIPVSGGMLSLMPDGGAARSDTIADLIGVRMMWVMYANTQQSNAYLMGASDSLGRQILHTVGLQMARAA